MNQERHKTILLVEDDPVTAKIETKQLQEYGYNIIHVRKGDEAIKTHRESKNPIDLILMDIDLGSGIDGTEASEIILKEHDIPILFLSSHTESEIVEKTEKITSYGYVVKNSNITVLDASIKMAFKLFQAHQELKRSEKKFRVAFTTSPDSVNINDMEGRYVDINEGFTRLTGYTEEDVLGVLSSEIEIWTIPEDRELLIKGLMKNGRVENLESVFRCKDGSFKTALMSAHIIEINSKPHILSITRDITDIKHTEKMIQLNETRHQKMLSNTSDVISIMDRDGITQYISPNIFKLFGWHPEDLIGKAGIVPCHPDDREQIKNQFYSLLKKEHAETEIEYRHQHKDGTYKFIHLSAINLIDDPDINGVLLNFHDISKRKKAEEEITNLLSEKNLLLKEVHHRISNNMNAIKHLLLLGSEDVGTPEAASILKEASSRIDSMSILYNKLYMTENYTDVSIKNYLSNLIDEVALMYPDKKMVAIKKKISDFPVNPKLIFSLGIMLHEMLTNTMKHAFPGKPNGLVEVSVDKNENHVTIIFRDDGIGLPGTGKNKKENGFGLELINILTRQIKGTCTIQNENGTKFIIEFDLPDNF